MIARPVVLSTEEYRVVWRHLDIGEQHWSLRSSALATQTVSERTRSHAATWESLRARGLVHRDTLIDPLADALRALAHSDAELNARLDLADGTARAVIATRGEHGVAALLTPDGTLRLHGIEARDLTYTAATLIPDVPAADGPTVSAPARALATERGLTGPQVERRLLTAGVRPNDARNYRQLLAGPKLGAAKYGAARHDRAGTRQRAEFTLIWWQTERGGVTVEQKRGSNGHGWLTASPADRARLADRLADLLGTIGAR